jgi:hypothetical protein
MEARVMNAVLHDREVAVPLDGHTAGRLEFRRGASSVVIRADAAMPDLFRAHFEGPAPEVAMEGDTVVIRYRRLSPAEWVRYALLPGRLAAHLALNGSLPWQVDVHGGASGVDADLRGLRLAGLEIHGGASDIRLELGETAALVPVRVHGGASQVVVRRPAGTPVRASVRSGVSGMNMDDQQFGSIGGPSVLHSPGWTGAAGYDVEVTGGASTLTVTHSPAV